MIMLEQNKKKGMITCRQFLYPYFPRKFGVNFGLTLSIWDYFFKTNYIPHSGRDIEIGFEGDERFPKGFIAQELYPFNKT